MNQSFSTVPFVNPKTCSLLRSDGADLVDESGDRFPLVNDIPRFCPVQNYADSFGYQWNIFDSTQIDVQSGGKQSEMRFYCETGWSPSELSACKVLEVGSGAGRFSEVFLRTTKGTLYSVDYSTAVDANRRNNARYGDRLQLAQASIYELPFPDNTFDRVFCLGVLQHTPSFAKSIAALVSKTNVDGQIVVDFYPIRGWHTKIHSKYILRPITKRIPKPFLLSLIRHNVRWMMMLFDLLCVLRLGALTRFIPIADVRYFPRELTQRQRYEWAVMDTFDAFSPEFDNPQRVRDVARMFTDLGCDVMFAGEVDFVSGVSTVVRAIKRAA